MRMLSFARRNAREMLRDPLTVIFSLGFPLVLLLLLSAIQANIPVALFEIQHLTPGISVFGLAFMSLFSATLIARDRESAFLQRLYTTPLRAVDFIFGYALPVIPLALGQSVVCYVVALALGINPLLDMFETACNVAGDNVGTYVIGKRLGLNDALPAEKSGNERI